MLSVLGRIRIVRFFAEIQLVSRAYHYCLAFLGALAYGFPSRKLFVIGVTGTKGKTTTASIIYQLLTAAGHKAGLVSTVHFKIGTRELPNNLKLTMPGRFALQNLLRQMVREGCTHAVVETSSEGILQYRHRFIDYRVAVFTNLSPEHIERHGGFENYRAAKMKLFAQVAKRSDGIGAYNLDDENVEYFFAPASRNRWGYALRASLPDPNLPASNQFRVGGLELSATGSVFMFAGERMEMSLPGEFNVRNAAVAITVLRAIGVHSGKIREALTGVHAPPGRFETLQSPKGFTVVVDYSYEPAGMKNALATAKLFKPAKLIVLTGSAGGGRDTWRRPVLGKLAAEAAEVVIVTTDDPYEEDPQKIVDEVAAGALAAGGVLGKSLFKILDRREAIEKSLALAARGDLVLIAGKGGEEWMSVANGKKIPWNDKKIAEELMANPSPK